MPIYQSTVPPVRKTESISRSGNREGRIEKNDRKVSNRILMMPSADNHGFRIQPVKNSFLQMQPVEEEEEMLQPKEIRMQPLEEEEEMLQPKGIRMQPLEEEEDMLQMQPMGRDSRNMESMVMKKSKSQRITLEDHEKGSVSRWQSLMNSTMKEFQFVASEVNHVENKVRKVLSILKRKS